MAVHKVFQHGEEVQDPFANGPVIALSCKRSQKQIFAHRERGQNTPSLRYVSHPRERSLVCRKRDQFLPVKLD
ncbi:hypothetical protein D9M70_604840 [compost metagenome]